MIIMMIGLGLGSHFRDALEKSGKETFTKEDLIPIHANAIASFCADFRTRKGRGAEIQRGRALETGNSS